MMIREDLKNIEAEEPLAKSCFHGCVVQHRKDAVLFLQWWRIFHQLSSEKEHVRQFLHTKPIISEVNWKSQVSENDYN